MKIIIKAENVSNVIQRIAKSVYKDKKRDCSITVSKLLPATLLPSA